MADINELDKKISVLESEFTNMKDSLATFGDLVEKNSEITLAIKARLDKQNGLIPHMSEDVKSLMQKQEIFIEKINKMAIREAAGDVKVKAMWGILTAIGAGVLGFILKSVLG